MSSLSTLTKKADDDKKKLEEIELTAAEKKEFKNDIRAMFLTNNIALENKNVSGLARAYDDMMIKAKKPELQITEELVQAVYLTLYQDILPDTKNLYRTDTQEDIPHLMQHFTNQTYTSGFSLHPIELAAFAHKRLIDIRPFPHGNHLVARMILNLILVHAGYLPIIVPSRLHPNYVEALESTKDMMQIEPCLEFITTCVIESEQVYLSIL